MRPSHDDFHFERRHVHVAIMEPGSSALANEDGTIP